MSFSFYGSFNSTCCEYTNNKIESVWALVLVGGYLSFFASTFMLYSYFSLVDKSAVTEDWSQFFHTNSITPLVAFLSLSDALWSLNVIVTYSMLLFHPTTPTTTMTSTITTTITVTEESPTPSLPVCMFLRGWFQISVGATLLWGACIATYLNLVETDPASILSQSTQIWTTFHLVSWLTPTLVYLVQYSLSQTYEYTPLSCYPFSPSSTASSSCFNRSIYQWFWFSLNICAFLYTLLTYCYILFKIQLKKSHGYEEEHLLEFRICLYLFVFALCWLSDIITFLYVHISGLCLSITILITYSLVIQLHGVLNCIAFGLTNRGFIEMYSGSSFVFVLFIILISPVAVWFKAVVLLRYKLCHSVSKLVVDENMERHTGSESSVLLPDTPESTQISNSPKLNRNQ